MKLKSWMVIVLMIVILTTACKPTDVIRQNALPKNETEERNTSDEKVFVREKELSEEEYFDKIDVMTYELVRELEELYILIPEEDNIGPKEADLVFDQATRIPPILDNIIILQAPQRYEDTQEKYKSGAEELQIYMDGLVDAWESISYTDPEDIQVNFDNGFDLILEAEDELYNLYYGEQYDRHDKRQDKKINAL